MNKNNQIYLLIALLIPVVMIICTIFFIALSKAKLHPQQNFIYMLTKDSNPYYCLQQSKAKLFPDTYPVKSGSDVKPADCSSTKVYQYDFNQDKGLLLTLEAASQLRPSLPSEAKSPDGFEIKSYCGTSTLSGWAPSRHGSDICVTNGEQAKRLAISHYPDNSGDYYYFYFLGWTQHGGNTHQ
ncbi:hypothetical protein AQUSIP_02210 [Aquicella siphonis]|uniref:Uncharacterized protein n=1 Tax=Aquicella siphonis TaxID=254247 RepID=A0A5E4PEU8_9COXI|nr:hypothetical protein [Aquicella siphonis]VVC74947.1 hypothetical protein AQUSIP_02210 [Aquicella siphonis]